MGGMEIDEMADFYSEEVSALAESGVPVKIARRSGVEKPGFFVHLAI